MADLLWLIPVLPLLAAAVTALFPRALKRQAAWVAIGSMSISCLIAFGALAEVMRAHGDRVFVGGFDWLSLGQTTLRLGWVLDPLSGAMLAMVTFVGLLIFIYSTGYMAEDENYGRFFCFLSLFAAAMLGLVLANSLLLMFICWELVGLASYLLIGFWYQRPAAAAAAKKAFLVTRIGDLGFLVGMAWWYGEVGTLLFYDGGSGCLEPAAIAQVASAMTPWGWSVATGIGLLLLCGAVGKSGQVPLHVWLPDAMEGPTPVSALIHAATMVAAGVFMVARVYPLMEVVPGGGEGVSTVLAVVTWLGAITALFAALIAVGQSDIKRILAYSTVSQLGYMFVGLGTGGVAVGFFHLLTHAFFKALLFLGAGSVIHGCHHEQDIRNMGGLRRMMPVTFLTYAVGMLALAGFPLFSGFWSKDAILHSAHGWGVSSLPFWMVLAGAGLTAFYMSRQVFEVFYGEFRGGGHGHGKPHESPAVMTRPLQVLAVFALLLGFLGTPFWPAFQHFMGEHGDHGSMGGVLVMMLISVLVVGVGLGVGWLLYGLQVRGSAKDDDPLQSWFADGFRVLENKFWVDELYEATVVAWVKGMARAWRWVDAVVVEGLVAAVSYLALGLAWLNRLVDEFGINKGFDGGCEGLRSGGGRLAGLQDGRVHTALRALAMAFAVLVLLLTWGCAS